MRIVFSKPNRAKKCTKALALAANVRLSHAQRAIAKLAGCRDWHELEKRLNSRPSDTCASIPLNSEPHMNTITLVNILSMELGLSWGDALYTLFRSNLPGIEFHDAQDYEVIWLKCFEQTLKIDGSRRSPGNVVKIKSTGMNGRLAILKSFGKPTHLVTHGCEDTAVSNFEVTIPRKPLPIFVPARLKLPYGWWTEADGSRVLFSRDYKPLWRLSDGRKPERLAPWLWIDKIEEKWFWDETNPPWYSSNRIEEEECRLRDFGIIALPKLADTLPDIVFKKEVSTVCLAVDFMTQREN